METMKIFLTLVLLLVWTCVSGQPVEKITIGNVETIYSNILKEERKIWVYDPSLGHPSTGRAERYPVLYLLDAEEHFHSTVGMVKQMSGRWPKMIVVGITNTNRERDLKPTSGGGEGFMAFIEKE